MSERDLMDSVERALRYGLDPPPVVPADPAGLIEATRLLLGRSQPTTKLVLDDAAGA